MRTRNLAVPMLVLATAFSAIVLASPGAARAADIFVNNRLGTDTNDGTVSTTEGGHRGPCATIAAALRRAHTGDRIVLAKTDQPYRESITLQGGRHSGLLQTPFSIRGNGAVLDGSAEVPKGQWKHVRDSIFRYQPRRLHHQQLFLDGLPAKRRRVDAKSSELPDLQPLEWCIYDRAIHFRAEQGKIPQDYSLRYAALKVGITLFEVRNVVITDLTVQGFQLDGVNAHDGVTDALLANLRCRGNGRAGIAVGGASRVEVDACLIGNNGSAQLLAAGYSITKVSNCDLVDDDPKAPAVQSSGGARLFVDGKKFAVSKQ